MAIDLETVNTVVFVRGKGIVLNEPSIVAVETLNGISRVRAVGAEAIVLGARPPTGSGGAHAVRVRGKTGALLHFGEPSSLYNKRIKPLPPAR